MQDKLRGKQRVFLSSSKSSGGQKILQDAAVVYIKMTKGEDVRIEPLRVKDYTLSLCFKLELYVMLLRLLRHLTSCILTKRARLATYRYNGIDIGRYAAATALRNPRASINRFTYLARYFRNILKGFFYYLYSQEVAEDIAYAFLTSTSYLNGIVFDSLLQRGVKIFYSSYPDHPLLVNGCHLSQIKVRMRRNTRKCFSEKAAEDYMLHRLYKPEESIFYFIAREETNKEIEKPIGKCAIVYAHSFTDAQLEMGYDGFNNVYEWLIYTIDVLTGTGVKVYVKGHPNFWSDSHDSEVDKWDKRVWQNLVDKYRGTKDLDFIDWPLNNYSLLSKFSKDKTLLVSHHGNAMVEGAFLGYMTLSSACSLWGEKYAFGTVWTNLDEYRKLLTKNDWNFHVDRVEALRFAHDKYMNPNGFHGKFFLLAQVADSMGVDIKELEKHPSMITKHSVPNYEELLYKISDCIEEVRDSSCSMASPF